ncbi:MAG: hypothetical protein KDD82_29425 [Planctomycetes bacterium]|nr:hypothetical protein [Planctomycetota bacterium]
MRRFLQIAVPLLGLLLVLWLAAPQQVPRGAAPSEAEAQAHVEGAPAPALPALDAEGPAQGGPRGTTWVVLRVGAAAAEVVTTIHKDALPYAVGPATADAAAVRFRLVDPDGVELTGPCSWPRLCPCDATASHTRGCVRIPHTGSVRLRLPRLRGRSTVVIERRAAKGWSSLARLEVDA